MSRRIVPGVAGVSLAAIVCSLFAFGGGCLTRPVEPGNPVTKTNFTNQVNETSIDKIDILFDIDNSASMGDKQAYLSNAIPDLIKGLVSPACLDANGNTYTDSMTMLGAVASGNGVCPNTPAGQPGTALFPPVHDMHIGILSSSLGTRGAPNTCPAGALEATTPAQVTSMTGPFPKHNDDQAHLLNRSSTAAASPPSETTSTATTTSNFLYWFPTGGTNTTPVPAGANVVTTAAALQTDFQDLVSGVHQYGCGIESQLETWYRFLVQPDPYASIAVTGSGQSAKASWSGVDTTILQQRHDFLRPDSLVLIVVLTDENDSEVDVRSIGGSAFNFMDGTWTPPRGTAICASKPTDPTCTSCGFASTNQNDAQCKTNGGVYSAVDDWGFDLNLRHVHEQQKYGTSVQFPIQRYVLGLTSAKVPNRDGQGNGVPAGGEYPVSNGQVAGSYQGTSPGNLNCVNPLFATNLPQPNGSSAPSAATLCNLTPGPRQPASNLVYYAHIGGVPHQLLQEDPTNPDSPQKPALTPADWTKILGNDPDNFDYTGIDPHMIESSQPRTGGSLSPPGSPAPGMPGSDPINGREWNTDGTNNGISDHTNLAVDREYACIFKLQDAKGNPTPRFCDPMGSTATADPTVTQACDCSSTGLTMNQVPAVCSYTNPTTASLGRPGTQQDYAKTYPTIRELLLAKKLGNQGIISSLCPIHLSDNAAGNDPLYGYRPAIAAIITRLSTALQHQCLPQKLTPDDDAGDVPCLVLVTLTGATTGGQSNCTNGSMYPSLQPVDPQVLQRFQADQHAAFLAANSTGTDLSTLPSCQVKQILPNDFVGGNCNAGTVHAGDQGWCYVENAKGCDQAIYFTGMGLPQGAQVSLQCLEASSSFATQGTSGSGGTPATTSSSSGGATSSSSSGGGAGG